MSKSNTYRFEYFCFQFYLYNPKYLKKWFLQHKGAKKKIVKPKKIFSVTYFFPKLFTIFFRIGHFKNVHF